MNLFIEQRTAKHHNKHQAKNTFKIQDISVRRDVKMFSEENCPPDDKCQNNSDKERKEENMSEQKEQQLFM